MDRLVHIHTHRILRSVFILRDTAKLLTFRCSEDADFDQVSLSGPTLAYRPLSDNTWWTNWLAQVAGNDTIPEQYAYHLEGDTDDWDNNLQNTNRTLTALLKTYGLPERQIHINEYANSAEQIPAGAAWWRLERYDAFG